MVRDAKKYFSRLTRPAGVWGSRASHSRITLTAFCTFRKRLFCSLGQVYLIVISTLCHCYCAILFLVQQFSIGVQFSNCNNFLWVGGGGEAYPINSATSRYQPTLPWKTLDLQLQLNYHVHVINIQWYLPMLYIPNHLLHQGLLPCPEVTWLSSHHHPEQLAIFPAQSPFQLTTGRKKMVWMNNDILSCSHVNTVRPWWMMTEMLCKAWATEH